MAAEGLVRVRKAQIRQGESQIVAVGGATLRTDRGDRGAGQAENPLRKSELL